MFSYQLAIDGNAVDLQSRLIALQITDKRGVDSDTLSLTLDNSDDVLEIPPRQKKVELGFGEGDNFYTGIFSVDSVSLNAPPSTMEIRAKAAPVDSQLSQQRQKSWHQISLGQIVKDIAMQNNLDARISEQYASINIPHIDQHNESDSHFLTRLAHNYGALFSVKMDLLLFLDKKAAKTATGAPLPAVTLLQKDVSSYHFSLFDRERRITGVCAYYHDTTAAKKIRVLAGAEGYTRNLKPVFANKDAATAAAMAEFANLTGQSAQMELTLAFGHALITPQTPVKLLGFNEELNKINWLADEVAHRVDQQGFITTLKLVDGGAD